MDIGHNAQLILNQLKSFFIAVFINKSLIIAVSAQFFSMIFKGIVNIIRTRQFELKKIFSYGGMPSSHSAFTSAFCFAIGFDPQYGFTHPLFSMSVIFTGLILMDTIRFRGAVDKLNLFIQKLTHSNPELKGERIFPKLIAHTPLEVLTGVLFGLIYTLVIYLFFYGLFPAA